MSAEPFTQLLFKKLLNLARSISDKSIVLALGTSTRFCVCNVPHGVVRRYSSACFVRICVSDEQEGPIDLSRRDMVVVSRDPKQDHTYSSVPVPASQRQTTQCQEANESHPSLKRARQDVKPEVDEELKEAAGSLLHLAGIRTSLGASRRKCRKLDRK